MSEAAQDDDHQFESGDSGASLVYPSEAGQIKKNGHIMIKGRPCKVVEVSVSKTGKHGHAKCHFVAIDIFTGKKLEDLVPSTHNTEIPVVNRKEYQLTDITDDGYACLVDDNANSKEDLKIPDTEEGTAIQTMFDDGKCLIVSVLSACKEEKIIGYKEDNSG